MPLGGAEDDRLAVDEEVLRVVAADEDGHHLRVVFAEVGLEDRGPVVVVGAGEAAVAVRVPARCARAGWCPSCSRGRGRDPRRASRRRRGSSWAWRPSAGGGAAWSSSRWWWSGRRKRSSGRGARMPHPVSRTLPAHGQGDDAGEPGSSRGTGPKRWHVGETSRAAAVAQRGASRSRRAWRAVPGGQPRSSRPCR